MSDLVRSLTLGFVLLASCSDPPCHRPECETFTRRAEDVGHSRLAGAVTDFSVFFDGCQECLFRSELKVRVWSKDAPPAFVEGDSPPSIASTYPTDGLFSLDLAPGSYVVCVDSTCYDATILEGATTTLNVREMLAEDGGPPALEARMAVADGPFFEPERLGTLIP